MAGAFFDDPVCRWLTPNDQHRRRYLPASFELAAQIFAKHDQTWCIGEDELVGAAIWAPAGVEPMSEAEGEAFGLGDRTGTPAYLDATSPDNRRLYERHGFRVIGELAVAGGPPVWQMWREP